MTVKEFKKWCPRHPFAFDTAKIDIYTKNVERAQRLAKIREENPYKPPAPEMVSQYLEWRNSRKPDKVADLPGRVRDVIFKILEDHPGIEEMWVCGSYASGAWIDEETKEADRDLKKAVRRKNKLSDLDLIIKPDMVLGDYGIKVDICHFPQNDLLKVK